MNKKPFIIFFALMLAVTSITSAQSPDDFRIEQLPNGTIKIMGFLDTRKKRDDTLVIPGSISGISVTIIDDEAFFPLLKDMGYGDSSQVFPNRVKSIILPNTLREIGNRAFDHYADRSGGILSGLVIPRGVTKIGQGAFANAASQSSPQILVIPSSVKDIGGGAFYRWNIGELYIESVFQISKHWYYGEEPFSNINSSSLKKITFPANWPDSTLGRLGLPTGFINYYKSQSKKAGAYTLSGQLWLYSGPASSPPDLSSTSNAGTQSKSKLVVWSFTDEIADMLDNYYKKSHPGIEVDYSQTPSDQFQDRVDRVLNSDKAPDVLTLESSFVRKYVESGLLLDLTSIYEKNKSKLIAYPVEVGTYNGKVYAMSWQSCPGAMFYRRSLARKYLGTDDPIKVQALFSDRGKLLESAKLLNQKSGGRCVVVSSLDDLNRSFLGARKQPWVVNGKLVIDPVMEEMMDIYKTMYANRLEGGVGQWSEGWFAGMKDMLRDKSGKLEVFSYFFPQWGLHYVLKTNAPDTSGDWAMIQGPASWRWGGTWIGVSKNTKNPEAALAMIEYFTANDSLLEAWANDTGDFVNSINTLNRIKNNYREPFLNGQNYYAAFADIVKNINGKLDQSTDDAIEYLFFDEVYSYVSGEKTKAKALSDFRLKVQRQLGL